MKIDTMPRPYPHIFYLLVLTGLLTVTGHGSALAADGLGAAPPLAQETASLLSALGKVIGALAVVVGLMLLVMLLVKKMGFDRGGRRSDSLITVLDNRMIAPKRYVAVLDIAGQFLAVGVTDKGLHPLASLEASPELQAYASRHQTASPAATGSFSSLLTKAVKGLNRKSPENE